MPVTDGAIRWTAPAGQWTVLVVEHDFRTSPTRSVTNPRPVKDTEQSLEDYLNPAATKQYLEWTEEQYQNVPRRRVRPDHHGLPRRRAGLFD